MNGGTSKLDWIDISGSSYEIGNAIGKHGKALVHHQVLHCDLWASVTNERHANLVQKLIANTAEYFPEIHDELRGLADGLELPFEHVFAWNCRGDLISDTSDGCTTLQIPGQITGDNITIAHNEDGALFFDKHCFIARVNKGCGFTSFCYPGSIPGHTFAFNDDGLVSTINNLRVIGVQPEIPRMVLARAVLDCKTLDEASTLLQKMPPSGGFHFSLARLGENRLISIERGGSYYHWSDIKTASVHANHILHDNSIKQIITTSSHDRQITGQSLMAAGELEPIEILRSKSDHSLPIWRRDEDDPDKENTMASALFELSNNKLDWSIYSGASDTILFQGQLNRKI